MSRVFERLGAASSPAPQPPPPASPAPNIPMAGPGHGAAGGGHISTPPPGPSAGSRQATNPAARLFHATQAVDIGPHSDAAFTCAVLHRYVPWLRGKGDVRTADDQSTFQPLNRTSRGNIAGRICQAQRGPDGALRYYAGRFVTVPAHALAHPDRALLAQRLAALPLRLQPPAASADKEVQP